jgi:tRNA (adenine22-N1)-methyltransferase
MDLSKRLEAVCKLVTKGNSVADVGCDHGYVSIYLIQNKISPKCYAMDVRKGPLSKARENIAAYQLEHCIETRLSDGLEKLGVMEADTLILAGMGGRLMLKILGDYPNTSLRLKEWILQPQSEIAYVRAVLRDSGALILEEDIILEDGKFYPLMKVSPPNVAANEFCFISEPGLKDVDLFGELLLNKKHPVLKVFVEKEIKTYEKILNQIMGIRQQDSEQVERNKNRQRELELYLEQLNNAWRQLQGGTV